MILKFVGTNVLAKAGYTSRKAMKVAFYARAKVGETRRYMSVLSSYHLQAALRFRPRNREADSHSIRPVDGILV
jgi:hypothetical protein